MAPELKTDDIIPKGNRLGFPKMPFKSGLSFLIIKIIALKDKRFSVENDKNGVHYGSRTRISLHLRSSKNVDNPCKNGNVRVTRCIIKICSQGKNSKLGKIIKKRKKSSNLRQGPNLGYNSSVIRHSIKMKTLVVVVLVTDSKCK